MTDRDKTPATWDFIGRVLLQTILFFGLCNGIFMLTEAADRLQHVSWYGSVVPARERLPYGENPQQAYNFTPSSLDAMFASHVVSQPTEPDTFRVLVTGDSATWGILLRPSETLTGQLNTMNLTTSVGEPVRFYNIGYPTMSLTKDLLLLDYARQYQPDAIIWRFTAQSFPRSRQLESSFVAQHSQPVRELIADYQLPLPPPAVEPSSWFMETIPGQRRYLSEWLRLQLYGIRFAMTGIDQVYPDTYTPASRDLDADMTWQGFQPGELTRDDLFFEALAAAQTLDIPVLYINEPMLISQGANSDIGYNFFYPRQAYDRYRMWLQDEADSQGWSLLDAWDTVPADEFTDSPVHMTPAGETQLADLVADSLFEILQRQ